ncbi:MAG: hypothetical protein ACPGR2_14070 [Psychrobium sp.]
MNKKIKIIFGIFFVLFAVCTEVFLNWIKNPYSLEHERLGPKGLEILPEITPVPNTKNYLMYPKYEKNDFVYILALPNEYIHPSNWSEQAIKTYSVSATVFYPKINGRFHPDNLDLPKCNGWCGGYMRVFIEPNKSAREMNNRRYERIINDSPHITHSRQIEDLIGEFGMDQHFQIRFPVIEQKSGGEKYATKEIFVKRDSAGEIQYLFECSPYALSPRCKVSFNVSSLPELLVSVSFGRHLIADWEKLIKATDNKVSSWEISKLAIK